MQTQNLAATKPHPILTDSPEAVRAAIHRVLEDGVSLYQIAVQSGISAGDIDDWLRRDPCRLDLGQIKRLQSWLAGADEPLPAMELDKVTFVETATSRKIADTLDYARLAPAIVVIYGGAGVGKTTTLERYASTHRGTLLVSAAQCRQTTKAMLLEVAHQIGMMGCVQRTDVLFRDILRYAGHSHTSLLIVDEAQHLKPPTYDAFRTFFDEAGMGVAYCGNSEVYARIGGKKQAQLPQIYSRLGMRLHIPGPVPDDVDALLEAHGLSGREIRAYMHQIASLPGGLRGFDNVVRQAKLAARSRGREIDILLLKAAANALGILEAL